MHSRVVGPLLLVAALSGLPSAVAAHSWVTEELAKQDPHEKRPQR